MKIISILKKSNASDNSREIEKIIYLDEFGVGMCIDVIQYLFIFIFTKNRKILNRFLMEKTLNTDNGHNWRNKT